MWKYSLYWGGLLWATPMQKSGEWYGPILGFSPESVSRLVFASYFWTLLLLTLLKAGPVPRNDWTRCSAGRAQAAASALNRLVAKCFRWKYTVWVVFNTTVGWWLGEYKGMDQYPLIPFLVGWTSIYQLFWCSPGYKVLTHPHNNRIGNPLLPNKYNEMTGGFWTLLIWVWYGVI